MDRQAKKRVALKKRHLRVRRKVIGTPARPRLAVFRSAGNIYAQVVDDTTGKTLAAASTLQANLRKSLKSTGNIEAAKAVGKEIAVVAVSRGIKEVCFDRGGRKYHGRVKALADAAREAGLAF
jgi:large subunit ribosomal protein L18